MSKMYRSLVVLSCFVAVLMLCVISCGDEGFTDPAACIGDVSLEVSDGTTPTFSWSPPHPMLSLHVAKMDWENVWYLLIDRNPADTVELGIVPPIQYGVVAPGASEVKRPSALLADTVYRVYVTYATEWDTEKTVGMAIFTP